MEIIKLIQAKRAFADHLNDSISVGLAYKIMKFVLNIETDEKFYNEKLQKIVDSHAEKDEKGELVVADEGVKIKDAEISECNKEIQELNQLEVDKPACKFTLNELGELKMSVRDLHALTDFIEEG